VRQLRHDSRVRWLALFSLALQFALSFGHVHNHPLEQRIFAAETAAHCEQALKLSCALPDRDDNDESQCSICKSMAIAASLAIFALPAFVVPQFRSGPIAPQPHTKSLSYAVTAQFRARAPPVL